MELKNKPSVLRLNCSKDADLVHHAREMILKIEIPAELGTGYACWLALSSLICTMGVNDIPNHMEVLRGLDQWIQVTCLEKALSAKTAHQNWLHWRGQLQCLFMGWQHVSVARAQPILTNLANPYNSPVKTDKMEIHTWPCQRHLASPCHNHDLI